jgi:hypothetical protein
MNPDWIDDFVAAEKYLREQANAKTNRPAQLLLDADERADHQKWQTIISWLLERGWRVAVDDLGEVWFYAPGPLSDPGPGVRNLN